MAVVVRSHASRKSGGRREGALSNSGLTSGLTISTSASAYHQQPLNPASVEGTDDDLCLEEALKRMQSLVVSH